MLKKSDNQETDQDLGLYAVNNLPKVKLLPFNLFQPKRIVFFVTFMELWPSVSSVFKKVKSDKRFATLLVLVPGKNRDENSSDFQEAGRFFDDLGIDYIPESAFDFETNKPHFAFYTSPFHSMYSSTTRPAYLAKKGVRVCYIPYACEVGGGLANLHSQFQSEAVNVAWKIFSRNSSQSTNFITMQSEGESRVITVGHPRAEQGHSKHTELSHPAAKKAKGRKVVLWNPHFAVSGTRLWSTFLGFGEEISSLTDEYPDLFFLVRPHPLLLEKLSTHKDWGPEKTTSWFESFNHKENAIIDTQPGYKEGFDLSYAIMSDTSSLMAEYLLTNKPILRLEKLESIGLTHELSSPEWFYRASSKEEIREFLDLIISGNDRLSRNRILAKQRYFGDRPLAPSSAIVKVLRRAKSTEELKVSPKHSGEHDLSFRYWEEAKTTFLAPESYYKKKEVELEGVLKRNSLGGYAADVGCGDGRFTQIISKFFVSVEAIDPSPRLISEARRTSRERETSNIEFYVDRLEDSPTLSTYDTVFVMGVTSGFLDDAEFKRSTLRIKSMLNPGGLLILTETLSLKEEQRISWQGYRAVYRNLNNYLIHWRSSGFSLIESIVLAEDVTAMRKTSIYVYRMES